MNHSDPNQFCSENSEFTCSLVWYLYIEVLYDKLLQSRALICLFEVQFQQLSNLAALFLGSAVGAPCGGMSHVPELYTDLVFTITATQRTE